MSSAIKRKTVMWQTPTFIHDKNSQETDSSQKAKNILNMISSVQLLSRVQLFATPWSTARQASLYITNSQSLPKPMSIESVMPSNHLILCCPLLLLPPIPPSIRVFSNESALHIRWPKYWSFSFNISPSIEQPGLISFRMDWLDILAVQGTLKSLLWHHSSKASILLCSAFFIVQLSHPYMTTGKTIALTRRTFVGKVMSLFFNILSRLVITFLPRKVVFGCFFFFLVKRGSNPLEYELTLWLTLPMQCGQMTFCDHQGWIIRSIKAFHVGLLGQSPGPRAST